MAKKQYKTSWRQKTPIAPSPVTYSLERQRAAGHLKMARRVIKVYRHRKKKGLPFGPEMFGFKRKFKNKGKGIFGALQDRKSRAWGLYKQHKYKATQIKRQLGNP